MRPFAVLCCRGQATKFPLRRLFDVLRGRVRWISGSGWCDQGLVSILVQPVASPTIEQIRFVQGHRPYLGNMLQVREALRKGNCFGFGDLLPAQAEKAEIRLQELGLPFSRLPSRVWRPLTYEGSGDLIKPTNAHDPSRLDAV